MRVTAVVVVAFALACGGSAPDPDVSQHEHTDAGDPPDSGVDAGQPDGGDAGQPDAGDAGQPDDGGQLPLRHSPIADENQLPGSRSWQLESPTDQVAAYANRTSALPGETVEIHAGAASATSATWQL